MRSVDFSNFRLFIPALAIALIPGLLFNAGEAALADDARSTNEANKKDSSPDDKKEEKEKKQPKKTKKENPTKQRLDSIEEKLDALGKKIESLVDQPSAAKQNDETKQPAGQPSKPNPPGQRRPAGQQKLRPTSLKLDSAWLRDIPWRSLGPANMGGRITDLVVHDQDPSLWWIATASGGLLKTTNQGITLEHQFDHEATVSIGCIAADPKNRNVLWVGTGEANPRNSVSYGDGVYKSIDGGKTWKNMGLKQSFQIGRILIHPDNTDVVYVGVLGRLYGPNRERGVYKTTDGGSTWEQVLYVDDNTGAIDMIMHPTNPEVIIAGMWDRMRDGFDAWPGSEPRPEGIDSYDPIRKWGPGAGLYKTTDGGKNWKKLDKGLPSGMTGRIGLDWQRKSPHTIYAIIDCEDIGKGPKPFAAFLGAVGTDKDGKPVVTQIYPDSPAAKAGVKVGDVLKRVDDKEITKFDQLLEGLQKKKVGGKVALSLQRGDKEIAIETKLAGRPGAQQAPQVWLGVAGEDREGKVVLTRVINGGPAAKAKLKVGDVVSKIEGKDPKGYQKLIARVQEAAAGEKLKLQVTRGDESLDVTVTVEERPGQRRPPARSNAFMGIQGENAEGGGASLTNITDGGPSAKSGLKAGDIVKKIDGKDIANYQGLVNEIRRRQPDDIMKVAVQRGKETKNIEVKLGDRRSASGNRPYTYSLFGQRPNIQDQQGAKGSDYGGIYKSTDAGETWQRVNSLNSRPMYFSVVRVDPSDDQRVYVMGVSQFRSKNGGITFTPDFGRGVHPDGHDLWIDPNDGRHMVTGGDGGFYVTYDYGDHWDHINTAAVGQFYHAAIIPKQPYWAVGGLQDNGSWAGPAISRAGGAINEDWISVSGGDGFVCRVDPNDPDLLYFESQNGMMGRRHLKTGERASIRPPRVNGVTYRFNWNTPFILSNHNSKIFYCAGNYVFRSLDRGNNLQAISPEITLTKRGSATAISESPRDPNVMYAGTDDGALWVTRDGGRQWNNITENLNAPGPRWVATIEASRFANRRVFVSLDGHRSDDDNPYAFVSEDFGETFTPLHKDLPRGSTRCLREDIRNENLLYLGTEFAFWVSIDRGQNWTQCNQKLPTVAVHEVAIHPTNGEIVLATHGRSLWACDVSALRSLKPEHVTKKIALHDPKDVLRWRAAPGRGRTNRRYVAQNPPRGAQLWYSLPAKAKSVSLRIENIEGQLVSELKGKVDPGLHRTAWNMTRTAPQQRAPAPRGTPAVRPPAKPNAQNKPPPRDSKDKAPSQNSPAESKEPPKKTEPPKGKSAKPKEEPKAAPQKPASRGNSTPPSQDQIRAARRATPPPGFRGTGRGRPVPNGTYRVTLVVDGAEVQSHTVTLERDPSLPADAVADEIYEEMLLKEETARRSKSHAKTEGLDVWRDD